ncbi:AAA family ATPase [Chryseobacterium sp. A321]
MYTEIIKIIEGGLTNNPQKVLNYSRHLAKKLKEDGSDKLAERIIKVIQGGSGLPVYKDQLFEAPVDNETRLNIADVIFPKNNNVDIVFSDATHQSVLDFISLANSKEIIKEKGLDINMSLLLYGPPGCGKTSIAKYIAKELDMPLVVARFDSLISSLLGSTAKNIRKLFDYAKSKPCILFLDEFDAIAKARDDSHETGELKRVINSLLQNIDEFSETGGILIAATNHEQLLDSAIWRRFEKVINLTVPNYDEVENLIKIYFKKIEDKIEYDDKKIEALSKYLHGYSHSEVIKVLNNAYYNAIIKKDVLSYEELFAQYLKYRTNNHFKQEDLIRFLNENNISQKQISTYMNISLRQVRNALNEE